MCLNYFKESEETVSAMACAEFCQWEGLPSLFLYNICMHVVLL